MPDRQSTVVHDTNQGASWRGTRTLAGKTGGIPTGPTRRTGSTAAAPRRNRLHAEAMLIPAPRLAGEGSEPASPTGGMIAHCNTRGI